ncbi:hypothetical protein C8J56DRAFT_1020863 [Mycena floridula]|nr:hypothetical protein C8J56DRAFT_1020863 [Mycena floridula]
MSLELNLGESSLVFMKTPVSTMVTQVFITSLSTGEKHGNTAEENAFSRASHKISIAIEQIIASDAGRINLDRAKRITLDGEYYRLVGERKPWRIGRSLCLMWGNERVCTTADKWVFSFEVIRDE